MAGVLLFRARERGAKGCFERRDEGGDGVLLSDDPAPPEAGGIACKNFEERGKGRGLLRMGAGS